MPLKYRNQTRGLRKDMKQIAKQIEARFMEQGVKVQTNEIETWQLNMTIGMLVI